MKDNNSFSFDILSGKATLTGESWWFKIVVLILLAAALIGLALILREWAGALVVKKLMSGTHMLNLFKGIKVGSP